MTERHKLSGLGQQKCLLSALGARSLKARCWPALLSSKAPGENCCMLLSQPLLSQQAIFAFLCNVCLHCHMASPVSLHCLLSGMSVFT